VTGVVRKGWVPVSYGTLGEQQFKERSIYATASFLGAAVACFASPFPRKLTNSEFTSAAWVQVNADYVVLGGGNVKKIKTLPPKTRLGANGNAFIGGYRLWSVKLRYGKQRFH
jgi:hypothetical protein